MRTLYFFYLPIRKSFIRAMHTKISNALSTNDPSSYSNPDQCRVKNVHLSLTIDFSRKVLKGFANLSVLKNTATANLILDTSDLSIFGVKVENSGELPYTLSDPLPHVGSKLEIKLPEDSSPELIVRIDYETSSHASALQWLDSQQTAGKKHPYMFSQSQAIHARSMFPCQDTPFVKAPYTATVTSSEDLKVLMSAIDDGEEHDSHLKVKTYKFIQKVPVPSYLVAIVCGAIESRKIGPRSSVWCEKEFLDLAADECSETEKMLQCAEKCAGEYVWEKYDILIMPPSFPFGGMENPCLTYISPTVLAGDKSNIDTIIHEIMHSWTGNLVTNKNFNHFWLNEGHTTFLERKCSGMIYGDSVRQLLCAKGWACLQYDVKVLGDENPLTKLVVDLTGCNPDEGCNFVPYEKGCALLSHLETILGGPDVFNKFLHNYIEEFKYQCLDTEAWKNHLYKFFSDKKDILDSVDWEKWLHCPGMPPLKPYPVSELVSKYNKLAASWIAADEDHLEQFSSSDMEGYNAIMKTEFLNELIDKVTSIKKLQKIDELYKISSCPNYEITFMWIRLGLTSHWKAVIPSAIKLVTEIGRLKFVKPVYRDLYEWEETRELAISNYEKTKHQMMQITAHMVADVLHLSKEGNV